MDGPVQLTQCGILLNNSTTQYTVLFGQCLLVLCIVYSFHTSCGWHSIHNMVHCAQ